MAVRRESSRPLSRTSFTNLPLSSTGAFGPAAPDDLGVPPAPKMAKARKAACSSSSATVSQTACEISNLNTAAGFDRRPWKSQGSPGTLPNDSHVCPETSRFSKCFLLLIWEMSRGAPGIHPQVFRNTLNSGGILRGRQTLDSSHINSAKCSQDSVLFLISSEVTA